MKMSDHESGSWAHRLCAFRPISLVENRSVNSRGVFCRQYTRPNNRRSFFQLMQGDPSFTTRFYRNVMMILRQKLVASNRRIDELLQSQAAAELNE